MKVFASMGVVCHGVSGMLGSSRGGVVEWLWWSPFAADGRMLTGPSSTGPFRVVIASRRMECRRCSCEDINVAEFLSPVQRVMSMQSRD